MEWYYSIAGETIGPVSFDVIQELALASRLAPTDLVWNADMGDEWAAASQVPGLFPQIPEAQPTSPELPPAEPTGLQRVSCVDPVEIAWERMRDILFRPFDLKKWFLLGFSAWLAVLGQGGGGGGGVYDPRAGSARWDEVTEGQPVSPDEIMAQISTFLHEHMAIIIGVGLAIFAFVFIIGLVMLWIRCRGKFMFLDNVVHDRYLIVHPWKSYRQHGNSLFLWNVVYGIVCMAFVMILLMLAYFSIGRHAMQSVPFRELSGMITLNVVFWLIFTVIHLYIMRFLNDFVVPLMYDRDLKATEAWSEFLGLLRQRFFGFIVYGLFYFLLSMLYRLAVLALILITCCIAGCLMGIPWVGAVVLIPAHVFFRIYNLEYLAQFGPAYRMRLESEKAGELASAG